MKPSGSFNLINVPSPFVYDTLFTNQPCSGLVPRPIKSCYARCPFQVRQFPLTEFSAGCWCLGRLLYSAFSFQKAISHIPSHLQIIAANSLHCATETIFGISFQV